MDLDASFGHWLTRRRKALRLSRAELARRVCCATITLRKIEEDARRPSRQIAAKLADHLAVPGAECATFIRVARGELRVERLPPAERPGAGAPYSAIGPSPTNLSIPPTPLIGRATELAAVRDLLLSDDVRLLTLIGAPGIGKTRLSLQVALDLRDAFTDGVSFLPLAPLSDPKLVLAGVAQMLGIAERAGQSVRDRLTAYLRNRHMLLVLDNFEHILPAAPQIAALLADAPQVAILVTSRVALHLAGEQRFTVPPLALPPATVRTFKCSNVQTFNTQITRYESVRLFIDRARSTDPHFALTDSNAEAVAEICVRLDGLPLAIELAATRINLFTPLELLTRLDQRFALLTTGALDMPARQQTLGRAIDWSYALLGEAERALFRRLGVFVGGWTLEAAEAVCAGVGSWELGAGVAPLTPNSQLPTPVLEGVAALVDHSLVRREEVSGEQSRFTMLETIREYALERLGETRELEHARERHLAYYLALAESAEQLLATSDRLAWLERLDHDHDNLRAALLWAMKHNPEIALRLSGALAGFWMARGHLSEGRHWLDQMLDLRFTLLDVRQPNDDQATIQQRRSIIAKALHGAGMFAHTQEDNLRAEALFTESLALAHVLGDSHRIALLLNDLGELALLQGDTERVDTLCSEGLALARAAGDRGAVAHLLRGLGDLAQARGDPRSAAAYFEESLALCRALDDRRGSAWALLALGQLEQARGSRQRAADLLAEGLALARSIGDQESSAWLLYYSGRLALEQPNLAGAIAQFGESARLLHMLGSGQGVALNLTGLSAVMIQRQELAQAARLLSASEAQQWVASVDNERAEHDRAVAFVRAQLDAAAFATAWAEGRSITLEQALTVALAH